MRCLLLFSCSTSLIVLSFIAVDAQPNSLRLPVASSPVPGNPPNPISRASDSLYPNVTAATPARYLNPTGTASYPVYNATDVTCAGPNGEKGKLRKRLVSIYASPEIPRPSGEATLEAECSIEVHVQPEASLISFLAQANEIHLTEDNLLGASFTTTPTVNTPIPEVMGDTVEIDYGPPKPASAKSTPAETSAAAYNGNDLTDMQMSQLHAALLPTQTEPPNKPAQSLSASSSDLESSSSSTIAPPQGPILNAQSSLTPHAVASKVPGADSSSNGAVGESSPNGKPEGAGTPNQPNAPGSALKSVSPSGGSSSHFAQGGLAQPGADSSNAGSSRPGSSSGSESGASGPVSLGSGSSSGSGSGSGLGSVSSELNPPASGSESSPGPSSSVISSSGEMPSDVGTAPGSASGSPNSGPGPGSSSGLGSTGSSSSPGSPGAPVSGSSDSGKSSSDSKTPPNPGSGSSSSGTGLSSLPGSSGSGSSVSSTDSSPSQGAGPGSSNAGSGSVPGSGSNNVDSKPQSLSSPSDSDASRTGSGFNGAGIIATGSQTYTAQQTGSFVVVGSHTVINGTPAITIASTPVSVGANEVLIAGSNTLALNQAADQSIGPDVIAIGSHSYTVQPAASIIVVGSNTLTQGVPAVTIASEPVSLGANGILVAGSNTVDLGLLPTGGTPSGAAGVIAIGSSSYTAQRAGPSVVLGSATIAPGAPAVTIASELVSLGANGLLAAGSNTMTLVPIPTGVTGPNSAGFITIGSAPYEVQPTASGFVVVGSKTISQGAPAVTIASEPVSLGTNSMLVAGSKTLALGAQATGGSGSVPDAILSQGGPVPAPSGNPASNGGPTSNNGSPSNATGAKPFNAGGVRSWGAVERWTWAVRASTIVAIVTCGLL